MFGGIHSHGTAIDCGVALNESVAPTETRAVRDTQDDQLIEKFESDHRNDEQVDSCDLGGSCPRRPASPARAGDDGGA